MALILAAIPASRLYAFAIIYYLLVGAYFRWLDMATLGPTVLGIASFSFLFGFGCGIVAPLALVLSLGRVETNRGAASALQGAIKMFFAGILLTLFNLVQVKDFSALANIFLIITMTLALIQGVDHFSRKMMMHESIHASREESYFRGDYSRHFHAVNMSIKLFIKHF